MKGYQRTHWDRVLGMGDCGSGIKCDVNPGLSGYRSGTIELLLDGGPGPCWIN